MEHQVDHGLVDHGLAAGSLFFIVLAESSIASQLAKRPLDDPSLGQHHKLVKFIPIDDLQPPASEPLDPMDQLPAIAAVGPDQLQPRERSLELPQDQPGPVAILEVRRVHDPRSGQPQGVDDDMSFSAWYFLTCVVASRPSFSVVLTD